MAATLVKMRMPSTTTTPVDSCEPTPIWSPTQTIRAAISTFETNETTNTRSVNVPSRYARNAPNSASRAATMAIGR